jgi:hypothetical protein
MYMYCLRTIINTSLILETLTFKVYHHSLKHGADVQSFPVSNLRDKSRKVDESSALLYFKVNSREFTGTFSITSAIFKNMPFSTRGLNHA